jgi:hypothetical protein
MLSGVMLAFPVFAAGNPYLHPTLTASPNHGVTGTTTTLTGSGFSHSVGITITASSGVITVTPATITTDAGGHFTAQVTVVTASARAVHITATGADIATNTQDEAAAIFTVDNINAAHSTNVALSGGQATVNDTTITGVSVVVSGMTGVSSINVTTATLGTPSLGVTGLAAGTLYFDVQITLPPGATVPAGATATVCFTNPGVTSGMGLQYWDGTAWVDATGVTITGSRICGTVPVSALTGTNFALVAGAAATDYTTYIYAAVLVALVVIVGVGVYFWRRRR